MIVTYISNPKPAEHIQVTLTVLVVKILAFTLYENNLKTFIQLTIPIVSLHAHQCASLFVHPKK